MDKNRTDPAPALLAACVAALAEIDGTARPGEIPQDYPTPALVAMLRAAVALAEARP